jgi:hypothetical protein
MAGGHTMSQKEPHGQELFNTNNATPATHWLTMQSQGYNPHQITP